MKRTNFDPQLIQLSPLLETLENPSKEVKRDVIRLLVDYIVVEDDAIIIHHIVPITENGRLSLKYIKVCI